MSDDTVQVEFRGGDDDAVNEFADQLREAGGDGVEVEGTGVGLLPLIPIAIAAAIAIGAVAKVVEDWLVAHQKQEIIDVTSGHLVITENADRKDGSIVVIAKGADGTTQVTITSKPDHFDLGAVIKAALSGGTDAASSAASDQGAKVSSPEAPGKT